MESQSVSSPLPRASGKMTDVFISSAAQSPSSVGSPQQVLSSPSPGLSSVFSPEISETRQLQDGGKALTSRECRARIQKIRTKTPILQGKPMDHVPAYKAITYAPWGSIHYNPQDGDYVYFPKQDTRGSWVSINTKPEQFRDSVPYIAEMPTQWFSTGRDTISPTTRPTTASTVTTGASSSDSSDAMSSSESQ